MRPELSSGRRHRRPYLPSCPSHQEALMAASKLISPFGSLGDVTNIARQPASIILDKYARIGKRMNKGTIATVKSSDGHILEVSLWTLEPPALSYFCINCHRAPDSEPNDADFENKPHMVAAEGQFLLLRTSFVSSFGDHEYFMYKAGNSETGKLASLDQIPIPGFHLPRASEFGIVPHGHDDQYILAALSAGFDPLYYKLHLYFSKDKKWRSTLLKNPCPYLNKVMASKVVTLGEGIIAWVDFQHGMLVCNVHEMNPSPRYIPLPDPLPGNKDELQEFSTGPSKSAYRDLACTNGVIKFVEIEHHVATPKNIKVHDSDLIMSRRCKEPKLLESWNGWKAVMWTRTVSSDAWDMGPVIDAADIMFDNPMDLSLLSVLKGEADVDKFAFKDLYSAFPTLSTDGDDILYLHTMTKLSDPDARMVALDLGTKRVKAVGRYSLADHWPSVKAFGPCTVPCMTTGKVSASACVSIKRAHSSAHDPNKTSICVGHLSSSESGNKRPRLLAEKVNHGHNRAQNIIQNDHISPVRRAQSNLHHNNASLSTTHPSTITETISTSTGRMDTVTLAMQAPPKLPEYSNYQPLWQHSQPSQQRSLKAASLDLLSNCVICAKRLCIASKLYLNYSEGTSCHGHSQQLHAPTSFAEGQYSDSSQRQQLQWQPLAV